MKSNDKTDILRFLIESVHTTMQRIEPTVHIPEEETP
jgi:hypothetical protein